MNRFTRACTLGVLGLFTATLTLLAQPSEDDKLNSFFKTYLEARFQQQPTEATSLGDHRFDHLAGFALAFRENHDSVAEIQFFCQDNTSDEQDFFGPVRTECGFGAISSRHARTRRSR